VAASSGAVTPRIWPNVYCHHRVRRETFDPWGACQWAAAGGAPRNPTTETCPSIPLRGCQAAITGAGLAAAPRLYTVLLNEHPWTQHEGLG
jgi:hypothetical protein